jgi:hypothetical protein
MTKRVIGSAVGVALLLGAVALAGDKAEEEAARRDVLDVARAIEDGKGAKVIQAKANAIKAKGYDLDVLMLVYKTKQKGGLGFGAKPATDSGIEKKIMELQRNAKGPAPAALKRDSQDLLQMAYVTWAMAEITRPHFNPAGGKGRAAWNGWLNDQAQASKDLIAAVKAQNGKAVAGAARRMRGSCIDCHQ